MTGEGPLYEQGDLEGQAFERYKDEVTAIIEEIEVLLGRSGGSWKIVKDRDKGFFDFAEETAELSQEGSRGTLISLTQKQREQAEELNTFFESKENGGYILTQDGAEEFVRFIRNTLVWSQDPEDAGDRVISRLELSIRDLEGDRSEVSRIKGFVASGYGDHFGAQSQEAQSLLRTQNADKDYDATSKETVTANIVNIESNVREIVRLRRQYLQTP